MNLPIMQLSPGAEEASIKTTDITLTVSASCNLQLKCSSLQNYECKCVCI